VREHGRWRIEIVSPKSGEMVGGGGEVKGYADLQAHAHLWVLARRKGISGWWPQGNGPLPVDHGQWSARVQYGETRDEGHDFEVVALATGDAMNDLWIAWAKNVQLTSEYPPVQLPTPQFVFAEAYRTVRKGA
jgi:hypothetical protein